MSRRHGARFLKLKCGIFWAHANAINSAVRCVFEFASGIETRARESIAVFWRRDNQRCQSIAVFLVA
ncbi:MAG: hypothetical protein DWI18_01440 [Planctomycetota bacterium]|nr:MAG: hypothetical protein DWI18_01440 [Planctomycetota bacterium]